MKKGFLGLKIFGARKLRLIARLGAFLALAICFSIEAGVNNALPFTTLGCLVLLLFRFFTTRKKRAEERKKQLMQEALAEAPYGMRDEFCELYVSARKRELRAEALLYLLFALFFALLLLALEAAGAKPAARYFGLRFFLPGLLLTALGLFLASLLRRRTEKDDALPFPRGEERELALKPDHRGDTGILYTFRMRSAPSHEELLELLLPKLKSGRTVGRAAAGMFIIAPIVVSLLLLTVVAIDRTEGWMAVYAIFLLVVSLPLGIYLRRAGGSTGADPKLRENLLAGRYELTPDRVESLGICSENPAALEVCFENAGRYMIASGLGNAADAAKVREKLRGEVLLLKLAPDAVPMVFLPENGRWEEPEPHADSKEAAET